MGLDLWFRADVARILQATHEAMSSTAAVMEEGAVSTERAAGYQQGFGAALRAVAAAFGLAESGGPPDRGQAAAAPEWAGHPVLIDGEVTGRGNGGNHRPYSTVPQDW